jgi:hypothetical protein
MRWQRLVLSCIALILFVIPMGLWGSLYIVGGDDARLYYLFPKEYLYSYLFNIISGNSLGTNLGYWPVSYASPVVLFIFLVKTLLPWLHTQFFIYGLILSTGFVFFYAFVRDVLPKKGNLYFWSAIIASLYYIFSIYVNKTFFQHQQLSLFLIAVVPGMLFFFQRGLRGKNYKYIVCAALFYSWFSSTFLSIPWFLATLLTLLPLIIYFLWIYGLRLCKSLIMFVGIIFFTNIYWTIHIMVPLLFKTGEATIGSNFASEAFAQQNADLFDALVYLNTPIRQITNTLRTGWDIRQGVGIGQTIGLVYVLVIFWAGTFVHKVKKDTRTLFVTSVFCLLMAMIFITPNFGQWNSALFQFLNDHVPLFSMFRNMYDKFALGMAFAYGFALYSSLIVLGEAHIRRVWQYGASAVLIVVILLQAMPFIWPSYDDDTYSVRINGALNAEYMELTSYIRDMDTTGRFLWYPMTFPGYVFLRDQKLQHHYYIGLSPLQILSGKADTAGFYGMSTPAKTDLNWITLALFRERLYEVIVPILTQQNIQYVIINNEPFPDKEKSGLEGFDFVSLQTPEFKKELLGEKIRDFGKRYSLYTINPDFALPTVFLSENATESARVAQKVKFQKFKDGRYEVEIEKTSKPMKLILLEPTSRFWTSQLGQASQAYNYGNAWDVPEGFEGTVILEFWPNKLVVPSIIFSVLLSLVLLVYCLL